MLTGNYLDQTFTGKLITAYRTHNFHPLERAPAGRIIIIWVFQIKKYPNYYIDYVA